MTVCRKEVDNYIFEIIRWKILTEKVNMGEEGKDFPMVYLKREIFSSIL